ncbi:MAG: TraX family protein [Fusicatenibacter sp.]|nr:conjugal transfer protein TraX [Fusicatenibacter sp.]
MTKAASNTTGRQITGSTLKIIAMVCMLIDHIGAVIVERALIANGYVEAANASEEALTTFLQSHMGLYVADMIMRAIGRVSFPIFCFLLIEGFLHTHDVKKYALNLGIFALISEIPFNLAFKGDWKDLTYQNVFFTLFLGLLMMILLREIERRYSHSNMLSSLLKILVILAFAGIAWLLRSDYNAMGILCIGIMYNVRQSKMACIGIGCAVLTLVSLSELTCFLAMIPVYLYNGERGLKMKYAFYAFYPVHLLLLFLIACAMGMGGVVML